MINVAIRVFKTVALSNTHFGHISLYLQNTCGTFAANLNHPQRRKTLGYFIFVDVIMDLPTELQPLIVKINVLFLLLRTLDIVTILQIVSEWLKKEEKSYKGGIKVNLQKSLLIWSPWTSPSPDFVVSTLSKICGKKKIQVHWSESPKGFQVFRGCVVTFESEEMAQRTSREVFMHSRSLITLPMDRFIDFFIEAEAPPSDRQNQRTTIVVRSSKLFFDGSGRDEIMPMLKRFGEVHEVNIQSLWVRLGVVCVVSYAHVYQAYAAKYYLDGFSSKSGGKFSVEVRENERERESLKKVKRRMAEFVDENRFANI